MSGAPPLPKVVVLLATHNGERWLPEQVESVQNQEGVAVRILALDDESTDGTVALLGKLASSDPRLTVLPSRGASGSSAANFYRLLQQLTVNDDEFVAFSDQDDIWVPTKLARHCRLLRTEGVDAVSSDVVAFDASGRRTLIKKSYPQRKFDYLLESPGPGSTFLISPRLARLSQEVLNAPDGDAKRIDFHDWLIYVLCRARGWRWHIDDVPSVEYRQHETNVAGANIGPRSWLSRLALIRQRWHREQATLLARVALPIADPGLRTGLESMAALLTARGLRARLRLVTRSSQLRRRPRDRFIIGVLIGLGVW